VYIDGAARGNPGPAAIGVVIQDGQGATLAEFGRCIGNRTNNQAEYEALNAALESVLDRTTGAVVIRTDSELLHRQMTGRYRVKNPVLSLMYRRAQRLAARFQEVAFEHVPRTRNRQADRLANQALGNARKDLTELPRRAQGMLFNEG
jgi:ribonuclease HI/probable phosphoglycerate mutase